MRRRCGLGWLILVQSALVMIVGCGQSAKPVYVPWDLGQAKKGPNGGHLMDLGTEDFCAELVHDKSAGTVTVYLFDDRCKIPAWGDKEELLLDITIRGEQREISLKVTDPKNPTQYVSTDRELVDAFDHEKIVHAGLKISAGSKDYLVEFDHNPHAK